MKRRTLMSLAVFALIALIALPALAHHPAADIIDAEIWEQIDTMVSDTPHGDMTFDTMGSMNEAVITGRVSDLERLVADDLLDYAALLDGDGSITIDFSSSRDATLTITQIGGSMPTADKAATPTESGTFSEIKAVFR